MNLAFRGGCAVSESSLIYLRALYYDPSTGQFISKDPFTDTTRHPYAYVGDYPLNATDPMGLCSFGPIPLPICSMGGALGGDWRRCAERQHGVAAHDGRL